MNIIVDTNILIRFLVMDNEDQFNRTIKLFKNAKKIIIPTHVFCEMVWVLSTTYKISYSDIVEKIKCFLKSDKVIVKKNEVAAGLQMMEKGGDFADGINAYSGQAMIQDATIFTSFDKQAVRLLTEQNIAAIIPD